MANELRALTRLTFNELGLATGGIGEIHRAIADRAFGAAGSGTPRAIHDAIAGAVYGGLRVGARLAGRGASALVAERDRALSDTPRGAMVLGVLNGLRGDVLEREGSELAAPMAFRVDGVAVDPADLAVSRRVV